MRTEAGGLPAFALQSLSVRTLFNYLQPDRHPAARVHSVAPIACAMRSSVALAAYRPKVRPGQGDGRVLDVLRRQRDDVVNDLGWSIDATSQAVFAQTAAALHVRIPAGLPGFGLVKGCCEILHIYGNEKAGR